MLESFFEGMAGSLGWASGFLVIGLVGWLAYRHFIGKRIDFVKSLPGKGLREVIKAPEDIVRKVKKLTEGVNIPSIDLSKLRGTEEVVEAKKTVTTEVDPEELNAGANSIEISSKKKRSKLFTVPKVKILKWGKKKNNGEE